jgi:hypothetical protein
LSDSRCCVTASTTFVCFTKAIFDSLSNSTDARASTRCNFLNTGCARWLIRH